MRCAALCSVALESGTPGMLVLAAPALTATPSTCLPTPSACIVQGAMEELAAAIPRDQIGGQAYPLYEKFRPAWKGWGAKGTLSLTKIRGLARSWRGEE